MPIARRQFLHGLEELLRARKDHFMTSTSLPGPDEPWFQPDPELSGTNLLEAEMSVHRALRHLGLDLTSPHLEDTPRRIIKMWSEMITPDENWAFTTFDVEGDTGMVLVRDIPFISMCSHHFAPFTGVAHIAYIPTLKLAGLSKFPRALNYFATRPQVQERLGQQTADFLVEKLNPLGVAVIIKAEHSCMTTRGVKAHGSVTTTSCLRGVFHTEDAARKELFDLLGV